MEKKKIENKKSSQGAQNTSWQPVALWYDELLSGDDTYQTKVILPNLLRLLPPKDRQGSARKILDIACGQGFFSKAYAEGGADVLGVDISPDLISFASKNAPNSAHFAVAPADNISQAKSDSFDAGFIVLAIQNIKEMLGTLKEVSRAIKSGGAFVIVLNHPCFRIPKKSAWGYDEERAVQYRRIDAYGSASMTEIDMAPGADRKDSKIKTVSFHRPLQDYFKALAASGFVVTGLEEWISHKKSEAGPRAAAEDKARKEFPLFMTIVAKKI